MPERVADPRAFYDEYGADEWQRLATGIDGQLEFEETVRKLDTHLPDSGKILDAGGGAGRYAIWLAERGYDVTIVDISQRQVEIARERAAASDVASKVTAIQGSITDLGFPTATFDATCCLGGPLSHVLAADDRVRAVEELRRVTVPDSPIFISVMGLLGAVQLYALTGQYLEALPELLGHGDYDENLLEKHGYEMDFTETHFFRREELTTLLSEGGISVHEVVGLEGLASPLHDADIRSTITDQSDPEVAALKDAVHRTNGDPAVADVSIHILAIGSTDS